MSENQQMKHFLKMIILAVVFLLFFNPLSFASGPENTKKVLILCSFNDGMPMYEILIPAIGSKLKSEAEYEIEFYYEYMDVTRFMDNLYMQQIRDLYRNKYSRFNLDLLIPVDEPALEFVLNNGEILFPNTPIVFSTIMRSFLESRTLKPNITGVSVVPDFKETLDLILMLHRDTKIVAVIVGASEAEKVYLSRAKEVFRRYGDRLKFIYLTDLQMEDLYKKISNLPEKTIVYYMMFFRDSSGKTFIPKEVLSVISRKSNKPIYSLFDTYLGHGVVGGNMMSFEYIGSKVGEIGSQILKGKKPIEIPYYKGRINEILFDWRELKRWGIDEGELPKGSTIRYRETSLWEEHRGLMLVVLGFILLQSGLFVALFVARVRAKEALHSLRKSEATLRAFIDGSHDSICIRDRERRLILWNPAFARSIKTNCGVDVCAGMRVEDYVPEDDLAKSKSQRETLYRAFTGESQRAQFEFLRLDGETWYFNTTWSPVRNGDEIIAVAEITRDVTEQQTIQKQLQEAEEKYRTVADFTYDWEYWELPEGGLAYVSPSCEHISGYTAQQYMDNPALLSEIVHLEDRALWDRHSHDTFGKPGLQRIEFRIRKPDNEIRWIEHVCNPVISPQGKFLGVRASNRDVTPTKIAEEALKKKDRSLSEAQRIAHLGSWDWNIATSELFWSDEAYRIFGLKPQEFGATYEAFLDSVHPDDRNAVMEAVDRALAEPDYRYTIEHRVVRPDGSECTVHELGDVSFAENGRPIRMIGTVQDITERKRMEIAMAHQLEEIKALKEQLESENILLRHEIKLRREYGEIIGESNALKKVLSLVEQGAPTDSTVIIQGETGTGKELIAQAIHNLSKRKDRPMLKVNCASLPSALVESELFGREKGAYTGALTRQIGRFEVANDSTVFLDEIGELSLELQAKLLRVLQDGEFERLGSPKTIHVDVRVIAATNRDLAEEMRKGTFRDDLFYRLMVFPIQVPPLRERPEDIPLLVRTFAKQFAEKMGKRIQTVPTSAIDALKRYNWPGNIRELRNVIEHAVIVSPGDRLNVQIPRGVNGRPSEVLTLEEVEKHHILKALETTGWRIKGQNGAAELLGMKPSTLYTTMNKLGIRTRRQKDGIPT